MKRVMVSYLVDAKTHTKIRSKILVRTPHNDLYITPTTARYLAKELVSHADIVELGRVAERVKFRL